MDPRRFSGASRPDRDPAPSQGERGILAPWRQGRRTMNVPAELWIRRLARFAEFTPDEYRALEDPGASVRHCATTDNLVKVGDPADRIYIVLHGLAYQYKL